MMDFVIKAVLVSILLWVSTAQSATESEQRPIHRGDVLIVSSPEAKLYSMPEEAAATGSSVHSGRRVKAAGSAVNGFIPLATKSGKAWVNVSDIQVEGAEQPAAGEKDLIEPARVEKQKEFPFGIQRVTFDLGGSFGSANNISYSEITLGLNTYFSDYFAWRNAVFGRFSPQIENSYGLDTSLRGILSLSSSVAGFTVFAGPGYRFEFKGGGAAFAEGGAVIRLAGISVGGGVKALPNDTQYFIILAGGGSL